METTAKKKEISANKKNAAIVNQYQYTDALMEEVQDAWAKESYKHYLPLIIVILVCAFFTRRELVTGKAVLSVLFAIIAIGGLAAVILTFLSTMKRKKAAVRKFHEDWKGKGFDYMITIEGVHIRSYRDNSPDVDLRKSDIRAMFESERFLIFQLTGERLLPLKKGAFIKGTLEDCRNYPTHLKK